MAESAERIYADYMASLKLPRPVTGFAVKLELRMSSDGKGIGVYAAEFIPAKSRVDLGHEDTSFDEDEAKRFIEGLPNDEQRRWFLDHIYCRDGKMMIDLDHLDTMMINHSANPSVDSTSKGDFATRDIHVGEELTEDYRKYDNVPYYNELCKKYGLVHYSDDWNTS